MPRAKQRTPELREHVLQVAVETLVRDGVAGFTTRKVAVGADTSTTAVYELFGDKAGLVREVFFEGFRLLRRRFDELGETTDPRADIAAVIVAFRAFARANPVLTDVMFSRPFADFDPGPAERRAGDDVRRFIVGRVRRAIDARVLAGDETDIAHALLALTLGLAAAENAGRLGSSKASRDRRWRAATDALLDGFAHPTP